MLFVLLKETHAIVIAVISVYSFHWLKFQYTEIYLQWKEKLLVGNQYPETVCLCAKQVDWL